MGFLDKMKNNLESKKAEVEEKYTIANIEPYLMPNEHVVFKKSVKEDFICLTDNRLIFINSKLLSTKKGITSVLYKNITGVSLEQGGMSPSKNIIIWIGSKDVEIDTWNADTALKVFNLLNSQIYGQG